MNSPSDHALGNAQSPYCSHCTDANGNLKSKEEAREGMINYYTQTEGKTREEAEQVVDAHMAMQPAWQQNSQPVSAVPEQPVEPVTAFEPAAPAVPSVEPAPVETVPAAPVAEEKIMPSVPAQPPQTEEQVPVTSQDESVSVPEPVVEATAQSNPVGVSEEPVNTNTDNSGTNEA